MTEPGSLAISLENVSKRFGDVEAVKSIAIAIREGEFFSLLGPSGCGKTTLLRLLAGLEYPNGGRVRIGDTDVTDLPPRKRDLAMVFQSYAVFPHLKVFDNIAFGLRMRKLDRAGIDPLRVDAERRFSVLDRAGVPRLRGAAAGLVQEALLLVVSAARWPYWTRYPALGSSKLVCLFNDCPGVGVRSSRATCSG